jgi:dolichol-phosphate mannosyltransferase
MPQLVAAASNGQLPPLVDPLVARDFVHVDDVCEAIIVAAARGGAGAVYNVGSGVQTTLAELVELVRARFGVLADPQWSTMERRVWDTHTWVADPSRIEAELGWKATTALEDGLWRFAEWMAADPDRQARYRTA